MRFALCSGASYFGTHLPHNFLNNRCSVTILCYKEREICRKWLLSSINVKWRFSILHSCTSSTRSSVMMYGLPLHSSCTCCRPAVNCLHQRRTIWLPIDLVVDFGFTTPLSSQVISVAFYSEREKFNKFCLEALISVWGSFTCRKSTTCDPWLYFPSKGSHTIFYALKKSINPDRIWSREPQIQWRVW